MCRAGADYDGRTALHIAAARGQVGSVRLLLDHRAFPNPLDSFGNTPLYEAASRMHSGAAYLLREAGGTLGLSYAGEEAEKGALEEARTSMSPGPTAPALRLLIFEGIEAMLKGPAHPESAGIVK